jgi:hypothetical protein
MSALVFVYRQQIASFLSTLITNRLQNEFKKLFGEVGIHSKGIEAKRKCNIDERRWKETSERNGLSFNVTPSK